MENARLYPTGRVLALLVSVLAISSGPSAQAAEVIVTAEFKPNAANPTLATFTNTTAPGFYCAWIPATCTSGNVYMFDVPITYTKYYIRGGSPRQRWYFAPPAPREVTMRNDRGASFIAKVAATAVSGEVSSVGGAPSGQAHPVFTASVYGCRYLRTTSAGVWTRYGWSVPSPQSPSPCHTQADGGPADNAATYSADRLGFGYAITTASPLALQNGTYEGELSYSLGGAGADIDFGDDVTVSDDILTLRFRFTVEHDLKVATPLNGETIRLQPLGGWARWSEHAITPKALQSELPFTITGSAPFSLKLDCEFPVGEQCAIRSDADGDLAPVDIAISMPGIRSEATGSDANRYRLRANTGRETFMPTSPVAHRPSRLHFNVDGEPMRRMLDQPGSHWQGRATLIFDTEID